MAMIAVPARLAAKPGCRASRRSNGRGLRSRIRSNAGVQETSPARLNVRYRDHPGSRYREPSTNALTMAEDAADAATRIMASEREKRRSVRDDGRKVPQQGHLPPGMTINLAAGSDPVPIR